jgi:hypothetical protein
MGAYNLTIHSRSPKRSDMSTGTGSKRRKRWVVITVACVLFVLAAGLATTVQIGGPAGINPQQAYQLTIRHDRRALFSGELSYFAIESLNVGDSYTYGIIITGSFISRPTSHPKTHTVPISVGGILGAKLICTGIDCTPLSAERQSVVSPDDSAQWDWNLMPHQTGTAVIYLVVTTYDQNTANVLEEIKPIKIRISINGTPSYWFHRIFGWVVAAVSLIGVGAIGAIIAWLWKRLHKGKDGSEKSRPSPDPPSTTV